MTASVYDGRACDLGEGALWHPERGALFWCDINRKRLLCDDGREWAFDLHLSALGWVDRDRLLIATEQDLRVFDLTNGESQTLCPLEADSPDTRSNDGRVDPWGGFWIGTMRKDHAAGGAFYRYYKGELRPLYAPLTIPNGTAFAPDKSCAYWADTRQGCVFRTSLDADGWPAGDPEIFLDLTPDGLNPDGGAVLADGSYLSAQWGAGRVARYGADGGFIAAFQMPATQITCPAMGGADFNRLIATSAREGLDAAALKDTPMAGQTFAVKTELRGLPEYQMML